MPNKTYAALQISSSRKTEFIDITGEVARFVQNSGISSGMCHLFVPHTTAAVTINENADPDVVADILMGLEDIVKAKLPYMHGEGNSPAHIKSSIVGVSECVFINGGKLELGTWQGIYFCEFDGPRNRRIIVKVVGE